MSRRILLWALALISVLSVSAKETIKVGAILPLSGNQGRFGESIRCALDMKLEQLAAESGNQFDYQIIYEDDQMNGRLALQAFNKLRDLDNVQAVLTFSAPGAVVAPLAQRAKIVHIGLGAAPAIYAGSYNFDHWTVLDAPSAMMGQTLQQLGMTRVAIITQRHQSCIAHTEEFRKIAPDYGLELVFDQQVNSDEKDTRTLLLKIQQANPNIILLNCLNPVGDIFLRQMGDMGMADMSVSAITCLYALERPGLKNIWWVDPSVAQPWFYEAFQNRYHKIPEVGSANYHDSLGLIALACEKWDGKGTPSTDFIRQQLTQVHDYTDAMGPVSANPDGVFNSPSNLVTVTDDFSGYRVLSFDDVAAIEKAKAAVRIQNQAHHAGK